VSVAEHAQQVITTGNLLLAMPVAAAAGFISFASPCVLPLVPGYLSYVSGVSGQDIERGGREVGRVLAGVALFVLGFSLVFMALGAALGALTSWLLVNRGLITRVAGVVVIIMGLFLGGVVKPAFLYRERRLRADKVPAGWPARCRSGWCSGSAGPPASARPWERCSGWRPWAAGACSAAPSCCSHTPSGSGCRSWSPRSASAARSGASPRCAAASGCSNGPEGECWSSSGCCW